ncbi:MAG: LCP family protein [Clostridia bacterium]|nr:LCP family protein [Clostridia bacterium]
MKQWFCRILAVLMALCVLCPAALAEDEDFDLYEREDVVADDEDDFFDEDEDETEEDEFFIGGDADAIAEDLSALERDPDVNLEDLEINPNLPDSVINILLIGVDMRENDISSAKGLLHNDVTMILSVNLKDGSVKLTSIARDLYVGIPGYKGKNRINTAYAYGTNPKTGNGGAELAMRTVNHIFDLNISQYVVINFFGVASIIEHLGGVDVDVVKGEALAINNYLKKNGRRMTYDTKGNDNREPLEVRKSMKSDEKYVLHLDGVQALMYARLRTGMKYNTGDLARTGRQRHLLELLLAKVLEDIDLEKLTDLITVAYPYVKTNISADTMFNVALGVLRGDIRDNLKNGKSLFEQHRIPLDNTYKYLDINGASVIEFNDGQLRRAVESVHYFIYDDYYPANP